MACKTCDHTMQGLGTVESGQRYFWCSRCGTLKAEKGDYEQSDVPRAWTCAMDVLRRVCRDADKILRDCDPERKSRSR